MSVTAEDMEIVAAGVILVAYAIYLVVRKK